MVNYSASLRALLQEGRVFLKDRQIESYILDASVLLCHILQCSKETLLRDYDVPVSEQVVALFHQLLERRAKREPIAYLLGNKEFYGYDFQVTKDTLVPRPDSEILVESVLNHIKINYPDLKEKDPLKLLDLGTGSGCLLLSILAQNQAITGVGVDQSSGAVQIATQNAINLGLAKRAEFRINNWNEGVKGEFDVIISNPPYIKKEDILKLEKDVADFEPRDALDGGEDGLDCYRQLTSVIAQNIKPTGLVFLECGLGQHRDVARLFEQQGFSLVSVEKDLAGIHRCIILASGK